MKAKRLKSQITMLMIVGLVMLIIVGLVLYLSKLTVKKQSQQNIKKIEQTALDPQPIKEFVAKCLDKVSKDAILLLGKQGGHLYKSQGGTLVDYKDSDEGIFFIKHNDLKMAYNILPPKFGAEVPTYPWETFPYDAQNPSQEVFEGYFGINNMLPLNASEGPNSMQIQLETFIDSNIAGCADLNFFKDRGYDISMNGSKTQVIIGTKDITVKSSIPLKITNKLSKEVFEAEDFSTNLDIGLRDVYFFAKNIINNDVSNIRFNITDIKNNKGSINIMVIKNSAYNGDIIIVRNEKSLIFGKPFEYTFARKNRAPALYYIKKNNLEFECNHIITREDLLQGSELKAIDPDEDKLEFSIAPLLYSQKFLPIILDRPEIDFKVNVSDGKLSDYQIIKVSRMSCT